MGRREAEQNKRRALAFLLAALLWAEGTFGSVCAAQEIMPENAVASVPADEEQAAIEEENPEYGEAEKPAAGEDLTPEETDASVEGEELATDGTDASAAGEETAPEETDAPAAGEDLTPEETDKPAEVSVSENTPDAEDELLPEQIPGAGEALGEPPLQSDDGGASGVLSYRESVMLTSGGATALQRRDPADIIDYYKTHSWSLNVSNTYSDKPSAKSPYKAGHLSDESLNNALNLLNFIRYVAGIPADVTLNEDYIELTQAGALLNSVNGELSHIPARPVGFTEEYNELYEKGYKGCSGSNIAWNYGNMAQSLLNGWMYDGDSANIAKMGHRRWVLNPSMTQTGFGAVGAYSAMYVFDRKGSGITDYVPWPARNMPIELMNGSGTPWTVSLGSDYQTADRGQVTVTLKDVSSGKTWSFSEKKTDGYFMVDKGGYGMPNCIIFRPNSVSYNKNSQFQVTVTGLRTTDDKAAALSYSVDFFSLSDAPKEVERVTMSTENLHLLLDDTEGKNQGALHAALTPSNAADKTVKWESLNEAVAAVSQSGVVTAVGVGETTITATAVNGKQAACAVRVSAYTLSADGIEYDENTKNYSLNFDFQGERKKLAVKDGGKPTADTVQWTSENRNVAAVDADGTVTPVGVGEATIWANVGNGLKTLSCVVKVENAGLPAIELREKAVELSVWKDDQGNVVGDSRQLRIYLSPADTKWKRVNWISSDDSVAAVSGNGLSAVVTARKPGNAEITAVLADENGAAATGGETAKKCMVTVREAVVPENIPCLIALTNIQTSLYDMKLPEGWKWKYPETALAPYKGMRSKTFPAEYQPVGEADRGRAETLLPVYFLTVENISLCVRHQEETGAEKEVSVLKDGWTAKCYVNYSFADELAQYEKNHGELKNNAYYQNQKKELLEELEKAITLTSSKPQTLSVGEKDADGGVALKAATPGDTLLTASLDLGEKTFTTSSKLIVVENTELSFAVSGVERFTKSAAGDYRYEAELSQFDTATGNQINSGITLRMTGVTKLTVKSSNSKVVSVKASKVMQSDTAGDSFEIPLIVRAAGMAEITVTGNDAAKTSQTLTLVVADACPGLSEETVTVNTLRTAGTDFCLYPAKNAAGEVYKITDVTLLDDERNGSHSGKFILTGENTADDSLRNCRIAAKADTGTGTYKMKLRVAAGSGSYDLPFTVKVAAVKPKCSVKQKNKLNLFYKDAGSLLLFDTEEKIQEVSLTGCNYIVEQRTDEQADTYWLKPADTGATLNSVKKGNLRIKLEGWQELSVPFTVGVEKKPLKISPAASTVTLYPKNGFNSAKIGIKNPERLIWNDLTIAGISAKAKGNYEAKLQQEEQDILLQGKNLNQADSFRVTIRLKSENWTESVNLACNVKVNFGEPAIALEKKTLQLNANDVYKGYDAASTLVRWKNGGNISADAASGVRVSVYCNARDAKAKELVKNSQVIYSVEKKNGCYQVKVRLNNKAVAKGNYQYVVQASKDGKLWKTALTLKIVDTAPDKAVKIAAKGSIDVLNREGSFMTLTPSLKAVNGSFVIPADRTVKLTGRDAHLFRAVWSEDGRNIELRAKNKETLVIKNQYTVTPILTLQNVNGETEEITAPAVKFKVKQGSAKVTASPKTALMYSGAYNSVEINMNAVLKGADAPEIEKVTLVGNTDAFTYEYNKEGKGTLAMNRTGRAVKGKTYSLQFRVSFAEQADNGKPVTVRYTVKVK